MPTSHIKRLDRELIAQISTQALDEFPAEGTDAAKQLVAVWERFFVSPENPDL